MDIKLRVWRQAGTDAPGAFEDIDATGISPEMSFLEMFDVVNDRLVADGSEPIAFDHDCREGICGSCSMMINGRAHGPSEGTATCQLHMRKFQDGDEIVVEPWRARAFPIIRDLVVDRGAFDRIVEAGGYISAPTGSAATLNQSLEKAGRVADFLEFGELLCLDALTREESCGGHLRVEHQTEEGEALRDDEHFSHVAAWEFQGVDTAPTLHKEPLEFEYVHLAQRSYK